MPFEKRHDFFKTQITTPWWIHPGLIILILILPTDVICLILSQGNLYLLSEPNDFLNLLTGTMSLLSLVMLFSGIYVTAKFMLRTVSTFEPSGRRVNNVLTLLGLLAVSSYFILFAPIFADPKLIIIFFQNSQGASYIVSQSLDKIPGVTSFVGLSLPFASIYSAASINYGGVSLSKTNKLMFKMILLFSLIRTFLSSERLALIEILVCYYVPRFAFYSMSRTIKNFIPIIGLLFIFALFSAGSYFRDWPYYRNSGIGFLPYVSTNFLGYIITSLNNGAGIVSVFPPFYFPAFTVDGFSRLVSNILGFNWRPNFDETNKFLQEYANTGFNNPCGLFVPYMDFGAIGGAIVLFVSGMFTGWLFTEFRCGRMIGVVLYPTWFIGILDIFRVWHWGDAEFWPIIGTSFFIARYLGRADRTM